MLARRLANRLIRLTGYPQEYLCLDAHSLDGRVDWALDNASLDPRSILFLGYRPLVFGLPDQVAVTEGKLRLTSSGKELAGMRIEPIKTDPWPGIRLFTGSQPRQYFLPPLLDPLDRLRQRLNQRRPGNVTRSMPEYDMLRIAYAQPREIHLAVVGPPERCNVFPTDLHGPLGSVEYVISLRHANKVCAQVEKAGRLLLCRMALESFREVYRLGARHQADRDVAERIIATSGVSHGHALPSGARSAMLLELRDHQDIGIHRLLRFAVKDRMAITNGPVLAHAHAGPLGWLKRKGPAPPVLLR